MKTKIEITKKLNRVQASARLKAIKQLNLTGKALINMTMSTGKTETAIKTFIQRDKDGIKRLLWVTTTKELLKDTKNRFITSSSSIKGAKALSDVGVFNGNQ